MKRLFASCSLASIAAAMTFGAVAAGTAEPVPGDLWAWGESEDGALGYVGTITQGCPDACQRRPTAAAPFTGFIEVSGGNYFSIGLKSDGTVWVWGYNPDGALALGRADLTVSYAPLQVAGLSDVVHVAAGAKHALALKSDGSVWAWGSDFYGETGTRRSRDCFGDPCVPKPTQVVGPKGLGHLSDVAAIKAGVFFSVALKRDGTIWAWGSNVFGELGIGSGVTNAPYPRRVVGINGVGELPPAVAIGIGSQAEHVLAVLNDATVVGWGDNHTEQLSASCGNPFCSFSAPARIAGIVGAVSVTTGYGTSFAVLGNGSAMALGDNSLGGLGIGFTPGNPCGFCVAVPTTIPGLANVVDIVAGFTGLFTQPMALEADGTVKQVSSTNGTFAALPHPSAGKAIGIGGEQMLAVSTEVQPVVPSFAPVQIAYPNTPLGTASAPMDVQIRNSGPEPLVLNGLHVTDAEPNHATYSAEFTVSGIAFPLTVQPGGSATIQVTFTPTNSGCAQAIVAFRTNAPNTPTSIYAQGCPK